MVRRGKPINLIQELKRNSEHIISKFRIEKQKKRQPKRFTDWTMNGKSTQVRCDQENFVKLRLSLFHHLLKL